MHHNFVNFGFLIEIVFYHLYGLGDVNFAVQAKILYLVQDDVNDNEGSCASNARRAVDNDGRHTWRCQLQRLLHLVDVVQKVEHTSGIIRDAVIWPSLCNKLKKR
jgi:hypothetical protein